MDAVLGLSVTPSAVGLVLVEGQDADGATMDRDAFVVRSRGRRSSAAHTSEQAAAAVMRSEAIAATHGHRLHSIGVTWSDNADAEASLLLKSLTESGFDNVVPIRLPEATEALARGIADVIGYATTAVCVIEHETVIALIVHIRDGSVQTAINHAIDSDEDLVRWLSAVFTRADWQPDALVVVGSGADLDDIMPTLEDALAVPVFAPEESQLALARGAALASAQSAEFTFDDVEEKREQREPRDRRRWPLAQAGPLAMLIAGALTFVVSLSVAVSLELAPKNQGPAEPRPAANASPETPAAVQDLAPAVEPPIAIPLAPAVEAAPPPEAPPVEVAPPLVDGLTEPPVGVVDTAAAPEASPADALPPEAPAGLPQEPLAAAPPPAVLPPQVPPAPVEQPGILQRIKDRLSGIGRNDDAAQQAPVPPPDAPALLPPP